MLKCDFTAGQRKLLGGVVVASVALAPLFIIGSAAVGRVDSISAAVSGLV